jgi:hypothetical protein
LPMRRGVCSRSPSDAAAEPCRAVPAGAA